MTVLRFLRLMLFVALMSCALGSQSWAEVPFRVKIPDQAEVNQPIEIQALAPSRTVITDALVYYRYEGYPEPLQVLMVRQRFNDDYNLYTAEIPRLGFRVREVEVYIAFFRRQDVVRRHPARGWETVRLRVNPATNTPAPTPTNVPTFTMTPQPTATEVPATATPQPTATPTNTPLPTQTPRPTDTPVPTSTPIPPTPVPPTPVPPTPVPPTPVPATPVPATQAPAPTPVPATPAPTPVPTAPPSTPAPATPVPTEAPMATPEPTSAPATAVPTRRPAAQPVTPAPSGETAEVPAAMPQAVPNRAVPQPRQAVNAASEVAGLVRSSRPPELLRSFPMHGGVAAGDRLHTQALFSAEGGFNPALINVEVIAYDARMREKGPARIHFNPRTYEELPNEMELNIYPLDDSAAAYVVRIRATTRAGATVAYDYAFAVQPSYHQRLRRSRSVVTAAGRPDLEVPLSATIEANAESPVAAEEDQ